MFALTVDNRKVNPAATAVLGKTDALVAHGMNWRSSHRYPEDTADTRRDRHRGRTPEKDPRGCP